MKSSVGLVLTAIAVATVHAGNTIGFPELNNPLLKESEDSGAGQTETNCNFACLAVMRPVTDENGVTYSNECMMRAAKCKGKKTDPLEEYKRVYGKSFGASRDDDSTTDDSASDKNGSDETIVQGTTSKSSEDSSAEDDSYCPDACLDVYQPVTDENGKTYPNECSMKAAKCKGKKKDVDLLEEYKRLYGKSFGASRDDDKTETPSTPPKFVKGTKSAEDSDEGSGVGKKKTKYCPNILCPAVYQPVMGDDGVMYSNKCAMEAAKCKGPRENPLDEYKRVYGKSFGASRDDDVGDDSASDESGSDAPATKKMVKGTKEDSNKSSKSSKSSKSTKTSSANGSGIGSLYEDGSEGVIDDGNSTPSTKCADGCPDVMLPVCGSDGIKYANPCQLKVAACKNPKANIVESACVTTSDDTILKVTGTKTVLP